MKYSTENTYSYISSLFIEKIKLIITIRNFNFVKEKFYIYWINKILKKYYNISKE